MVSGSLCRCGHTCLAHAGHLLVFDDAAAHVVVTDCGECKCKQFRCKRWWNR